MAICFNGSGADDVWHIATSALLQADNGIQQDSRLGNTRELLHAVLTIHNPRDRWVRSRHPGINPAFAIAEVFWILSGSDEALNINFWNPALPRFAGAADRYHGAYGHRLRNKFGFDQIECAYHALCGNPTSRQVVLQIWDARSDFPFEAGVPASPDIPCNVCGMLKLRQGKLDWTQLMRSNDVFRGTPYNIVQFTMLQEIMAGWLGCEVGDYVQYCDSLHAYESDLQVFALEKTAHLPASADNLALPKAESDQIIQEMIDRLNEMTRVSLSQAELHGLVYSSNVPTGYRNLLLIAGADSARRHGWDSLMTDMATDCTDSALASSWEKWRRSRIESLR